MSQRQWQRLCTRVDALRSSRSSRSRVFARVLRPMRAEYASRRCERRSWWRVAPRGFRVSQVLAPPLAHIDGAPRTPAWRRPGVLPGQDPALADFARFPHLMSCSAQAPSYSDGALFSGPDATNLRPGQSHPPPQTGDLYVVLESGNGNY